MFALKKLLILAGDVAALYAALFLTLLVRYGAVSPESWRSHFAPFSIIFLLWLFVFYLSDLYRLHSFRRKNTLFTTLTTAVALSTALSTIAFYLFGDFFRLTPKTNLLIFGALFLLIDFLFRNSMLAFFKSGATNIVMLGTTPLTARVIDYLKETPHAGFRVVEWIKEIRDVERTRLDALIREREIGMAVIQPHLTKDFATLHAIYRLLPLKIAIINFWDFYELLFEKAPIEEVEEGWFIENVTSRKPFYDTTKRCLDFSLALLLAIALIPLAALIALLVVLTSRGSAIYAQERMGENGKRFMLYKFRTMVQGEVGPLWTEENDKRITSFGKLLRFTHLDELPQLWNIIRGDISFTGPRPERVELAAQYEKFPYYEIRHIVKPGLTGWAQINFRPSASMEEAYEKLCYDIYYVKNRSFVLDVLIIVKTIKYIFTAHH